MRFTLSTRHAIEMWIMAHTRQVNGTKCVPIHRWCDCCCSSVCCVSVSIHFGATLSYQRYRFNVLHLVCWSFGVLLLTVRGIVSSMGSVVFYFSQCCCCCYFILLLSVLGKSTAFTLWIETPNKLVVVGLLLNVDTHTGCDNKDGWYILESK